MQPAAGRVGSARSEYGFGNHEARGLLLVVCVALAVALGALLLVVGPATGAATFQEAGFTQAQVVTGLERPTSMAFAPDGRIFVTEQDGALRVAEENAQGDYELLPQPFLRVMSDSTGERGLLGIAFDPQFATNQYLYVYHTVPATASRAAYNRIVRFRADPQNQNRVKMGSARVLLNLDPLDATTTNHNGGAVHFGEDGKLYAAVGDNVSRGDPERNSQTLNTLLGKMVRINRDGTIPRDNPFYAQTTGRNKAIWARGLRNPFTFAVQPGSGRIFINDVGASTYEEINRGEAGANYGWPYYEGPDRFAPGPQPPPNFQQDAPIFYYKHGETATTGCAITAGTFYNPPQGQFPSGYRGDYFFADVCSSWIRRYDPATDSATGFATGAESPVDLDVSEDGSLFYLSRRIEGTPSPSGAISRISYQAP